MASARSRTVNPDTTRPLDFDARHEPLDLPPRRPQPPDLSDDDGKPIWAQGLLYFGWVIGGVITLATWLLWRSLAELGNANAALPFGDEIGIFLWAVFIGVIVSVGLHILGHNRANAGHRALRAEMVRSNDHVYEQLRAKWVASRPLRQLALSQTPMPALRNLMGSLSGSLVLGVVPDTQQLATVGRQSSVLVLAPAQSGKTTCLAVPMLYAHYGPAVVTSTKNDLLNWTVEVRGTRGDIWIFDPAGDWADKFPPGAKAAYWTPLWSSCTWKSARVTADSMIKATAIGRNEHGVHWTTTARMCLAPCLLAAALHHDLTMIDILDWVAERDFDVAETVLSHIAEDPAHPQQGDAVAAWRSLRSMLKTEGDQRDGILGTLTTVLEAYNSVHFEKNKVRQNFDPAVFVRSRDTVYVAAKSRTQAEFAPVFVAFIDALQQAGYDYDEADPFHHSDRPSLLMCLDEAANVAPMRELPRYLSEAGGQGVQMVIVLQSLGQARQVWPAEAQAFLDYFSTIVAFGGLSEDATVKALSVLSGDYDRQYISNSLSRTTSEGVSKSRTSTWLNPDSRTTGSNVGSSDTSGQSTSVHKERRLTEGDIASLPPRHALVISKHERTARNTNFTILELVPAYESPWTNVRKDAPGVIGGSEEPADLRRPVTALPPLKTLWDKYFAEAPSEPAES